MVQRYYIHPMAFGAVKNPGYGHIGVVKYEDYERLKQEFMDYVVIKEKQIAKLESMLESMLEVADDNR